MFRWITVWEQKKTKSLILPKSRKKLWHMKLMVISNLTGALGTVRKVLEMRVAELEIRGIMKIIQDTALLRSVRILRRVQEICREMLSFRLH